LACTASASCAGVLADLGATDLDHQVGRHVSHAMRVFFSTDTCCRQKR
jgi:hypothetical protein